MKDSIRRVVYYPQIVYAHRSRELRAICGGVKTGFDSGRVSIDKVVSEIKLCACLFSDRIVIPALKNITEINKRAPSEKRPPKVASIRLCKKENEFS